MKSTGMIKFTLSMHFHYICVYFIIKVTGVSTIAIVSKVCCTDPNSSGKPLQRFSASLIKPPIGDTKLGFQKQKKMGKLRRLEFVLFSDTSREAIKIYFTKALN